MKTYNLCIGGQWVPGGKPLPVINPYTGASIYETQWATAAQVEQAIAHCAAAAPITFALPVYKRYEILRNLAALIRVYADELSNLICQEAGKPIQYARAETARAEMTFSLAADYLRATEDALLRLDLAPGHEGRLGLVRRFAAGPVLGFSPFNFPLNLVAHKIAPSIMAGCPFVLKPAPRTPITALRLAELVLQAGYPAQAINVLNFDNTLAAIALTDPRFAVFSFTGSVAVGWQLKASAGKKKVILELGGDAAAVITPDADLPYAARQCAQAGYAYAGQVCISIQRIVVHQRVYAQFCELFLAEMAKLESGDPARPDVVVGPLIDKLNYDRVLAWTQEARDAGATVTGGATEPEHNLVKPIVVQKLPRNSKIATNEAFAPLVELISVPDMDAAWAAVNASSFGLQAAIYAKDEAVIKQAFNNLQVGGIIVNNPPSLRIDSMPYGGVKDSGFGREGVRYAYEEMTEPRLLVW